MNIRKHYRIASWLLMITLTVVTAPEAADVDYLEFGDLAAITAASASAIYIGSRLTSFDSTKKSLVTGPLPLESSLQSFLGGRCSLGKSNFLDGRKGAAYTPTFAIAGLIGANAAWPREKRGKDILQDAFLLGSGLAATKGITDMVKGLVARQRPLPSLHPDLARQRTSSDFRFDHQSFFSGHTSSAFFSSLFLNKRIRAVMRQELTNNEYRRYRWAPSVTFIGWASFVGWSRIHAYRHYLSDVLAGAALGYAMSELFFSFTDENTSVSSGGRTTPMFIRLSFPL